jgi:hypothetical protein
LNRPEVVVESSLSVPDVLAVIKPIIFGITVVNMDALN